MASEVKIEGRCDSRFEPVREAFASNFARGAEVGACLAVVVDGRPVVDLWGGFRDAARTRSWEHDTLVNVFSCTKGLIAVLAHQLVERGLLDLDAPVARYWPEFAQAGKATLPVRFLLDHRAGLPAIAADMPFGSLSRWDAMVSALAETPPWWTPGERHGYHGVTYGHLVGEVIRRVTERSVGRALREDLAAPLGVDLFVGLPAAELARTAPMVEPPPLPPDQPVFFAGMQELGRRAFFNPSDCSDVAYTNSPAFLAAEIPAANGVTNARTLARVYGALARGGSIDGVRVLAPETIARASAVQADGLDEVMQLPTRFALGFQVTQPAWRFGPGAHSYGHNGSGGSLGFADPDAKLGFGYAMTQMWWGPTRSDPRWDPIFETLYAAL